MILGTALLCLAANIFHEARGEPVMGRYAVALVTLNRAEHDPSKVCGVVAKRRQFSWTNREFGLATIVNGKIVLKRDPQKKDADSWDAALKIAAATLSGKMLDFTKGATFYHAKSAKPYWRTHFEKVAAYGNHLFYRYNQHKSKVT